jgi:hypothetical protein
MTASSIEDRKQHEVDSASNLKVNPSQPPTCDMPSRTPLTALPILPFPLSSLATSPAKPDSRSSIPSPSTAASSSNDRRTSPTRLSATPRSGASGRDLKRRELDGGVYVICLLPLQAGSNRSGVDGLSSLFYSPFPLHHPFVDEPSAGRSSSHASPRVLRSTTPAKPETSRPSRFLE